MRTPNHNLSYRPLKACDLATRVAWLRDPGIRRGITIDFWPTLPEMEAWFARVAADHARRDLVFEDTGQVVSMFGITDIDIAQRTASYYGYVDPTKFRRGYGHATVEAALSIAQVLSLEVLRLETHKMNIAAQKLYAKHGFSTESRNGQKLVMAKTI